MDHHLITQYFPSLTVRQQAQFAALDSLYRLWNGRINVVSRKDIDSLYLHHVLHSLSIAKCVSFEAGIRVWDVGTGGGFPGIPLAIFFPEVHFFLCDSVAKKIRVVNEVVGALGLTNVSTAHIRAEEVTQEFDFVVSRSVASLSQLVSWVWGKMKRGVVCLKGGDLNGEVAECVRMMEIPKKMIKEISVSQWFSEPFFEEKKIVYIGV